MSEWKATIQDRLEAKREDELRNAGIPEDDIEFSRLSGIDARDVLVFRQTSLAGLIIVVRCPKTAGRIWHGLLPPKPWAVKDKSGESGVVVTEDRGMFVSDYDLMSVWRRDQKGWKKVVVSAAGGAASGKWQPEAIAVVVNLNKRLISRIQHGCQDDFDSPSNRGVKPEDQFAAFREGMPSHFDDPAALKAFYDRNGLVPWPYNSLGKFNSSRG